MKRLLFVLAFSVLTGCGTGYYDTLYNQHLEELKLTTTFAVLWPGASEIPGTDLAIRLPKIFEKVYNKNSIYSDDAHGEIDLDRLNPPFLNPFPGLVNCYEVFQKDPAGANLPVYLYTGVPQLTAEGKTTLQQELLAKIKALPADASWEDVTALTPRGEKVAWKKMEAKMPQVFYPAGQGKMGAQTLPGVFQLWWYDTPTGAVLLGWRMPDSLVGQLNLVSLATLTAGTMAAKPEDAKPADDAQPAAAAAVDDPATPATPPDATP